ncbi:MAG: hypothetical protein CVT73_06390 [Alphaproteobacteria bacterium HGW-Alphaproteobacteria-12]|nr:MAG: hypothetical protein CVT73_06390 [Alphaproteobacteria bacterium HGW-Alphaproteobacteria-12]
MQVLSLSRRHRLLSTGAAAALAGAALYVLAGATPAYACDGGGNYNFNENWNYNSNTNYNSNSNYNSNTNTNYNTNSNSNSNSTSLTIRTSVSS